MKRKIAWIMSAVLLATVPTGTAFAIESDAVDGTLILEEEAELETEVSEVDTEEEMPDTAEMSENL
ncbi:MAG: hypothetical protein LUF30_11375 [Lachnospiraceae bacterium]|nr:hypothetical protein [Lachnospiraceae bacterium]